ncbi:hypothetical protein MBLNU230_g6361t1 [Neophaeotheca triangularis]
MYGRTLQRVAVGAQRQLLLNGWTRNCATSTTATTQSSEPKIDPEALLSRQTWSVASLIPSATMNDSTQTQEVTPKQLHHLLRLSALPPPSSEQEEQQMLATLSSQLHFVRSIQEVDTTDVQPLRSLRDETKQGERETELGLDALREALGKEEVRGKYHKRIRRIRGSNGEHEQWDVLGGAEKKVGRSFVVDGGKTK